MDKILALLLLFSAKLDVIKDDITDIPMYEISMLDSEFREVGLSFLKLLSKEDRETLVKRGALIITPFKDGMERLYTLSEVIYFYEQYHYDKKTLMDAMRMEGAKLSTMAEEFAELDSFLKTDISILDDEPNPEITDEQYGRAKTYLEIEKLVDLYKEDVNMTPMERLDIISDLVDYTLSISSLNDERDVAQEMADKVLAVVNKAK